MLVIMGLRLDEHRIKKISWKPGEILARLSKTQLLHPENKDTNLTCLLGS